MIKFQCPSCGCDRLECVEDGPYSSEIEEIEEEGDFEFGPIQAAGFVDRFQCVNCGYILENKDGVITDNLEVVEWCKEHCKQEE